MKRNSILFMILFSWPALFCGMSGLILCVHPFLQMHLKMGQINNENCETPRSSSESSLQNLVEIENCFDVELDALEPVTVNNENADFEVIASPSVQLEANFGFGLTLRELAPDLQAQAPPALIALSVQTVQLTQLRI